MHSIKKTAKHSLASGAAVVTALMLVCGAAPASAQDKRFYVGNDLGLSTLDFNTRRLGNFNPNAGIRTTVDDRDMSYGVFAGYRAERNFGLEVGFNRFGKTKVTISDGINSASSSVKSEGAFVAGLYHLPLPANFTLVGKLGVSNSKSNFNLFPFGTDNRSKVNPLYGVGLGYKLGESLSLRAEYNRIPNFADNDRDLSNAKLGLIYGF
jgi:OOP family OmpA-OmpF porin